MNVLYDENRTILNNSYLKYLREKALAFAYRSQLSHHAEDFAQYALMRAITSGHRIRIFYVFNDYLRMMNGDIRSAVPSHSERLYNDIQYCEEKDEDYPEQWRQINIAAPEKRDPKKFKKIVDRMNLPTIGDRVYLFLYYYYGFSLQEIAEMFAVTDSAISIGIDRIEKMLKKSLKPEDFL